MTQSLLLPLPEGKTFYFTLFSLVCFILFPFSTGCHERQKLDGYVCLHYPVLVILKLGLNIK